MKTITDLISTFNEKDKIALIHKTDFRTFKLTYQELYNKILKTSSLFNRLKLRKGDKIILWGYNSPQWIISFLAAALNGIIIVPIDYMANTDYVKKINNIVKSKLTIHSEYKIPPKNSTHEIILENLDRIIEDINPALPKTKTKENDILEIVFTSGTTGNPKGVILTNKNLISNINSIKKHIDLKENQTFLSLLPLSHLFEQNPGFLAPLSSGCSIVYIGSLKPSIIFKALSQEKITNMIIVPRLLQLFADKIKREIEAKNKTKIFNKLMKLKLSKNNKKRLFSKIHSRFGKNFKYFIVGGAPFLEELESFWENLGFKIIQGYGLTECSPVLTVNSLKKQKKGSVGITMTNIKIKINKTGEIYAKGENITKGYYLDKKKTSELFDDGWMKTGDIGYIDEEGFIHLKGRKKDIIITSAGINVYPEDIEQILMADSSIKDACVLGLPSKTGEEVHAEIILKNKYSRLKDIINNANKKLNQSQKILSYSIWDKEDFPRTTTMKIKKPVVLEEISKRAKTKDIQKTTPKSKLYEHIAQVCKINIGSIKPNSKLSADLKLTSINRIELISLIEQEFNLDIDEEEISAKTTVKDLENTIKERKKISKKDIFKPWLLTFPIRVLRFIYNLIIGENITRLFCRIKVIGKKNLNELKEPAIFIANHIGYFDVPSIVMSLPFNIKNRIAIAALKEYFEIPKNQIFKRLLFNFYYQYASLFFNIYLFPKTKGFKKSLEYTGELLDKKWNILFFPEGEHSKSGKLHPFKKGIGLLAKEMKVPIVPIKHSGLENIMLGASKSPKFGKITIKIGRPVKLDYTRSIPEITNKLQKLVESL